jgi:hypothetical protein
MWRTLVRSKTLKVQGSIRAFLKLVETCFRIRLAGGRGVDMVFLRTPRG